MTQLQRLMTAEEFWGYSSRLRGILSGYVLFYNEHDDAHIIEENEKIAWLITARELLVDEPMLIDLLPEKLGDFFKCYSDSEFHGKLQVHHWNDIATALNEFIKTDPSETNRFFVNGPETFGGFDDDRPIDPEMAEYFKSLALTE